MSSQNVCNEYEYKIVLTENPSSIPTFIISLALLGTTCMILRAFCGNEETMDYEEDANVLLKRELVKRVITKRERKN